MHPARPHPAKRLPRYAFPLAAASVYAVVLVLLRTVPEAARPGPVAWGIVADLLITVPALWYLLVVRGRGVPARTLFPIVALSFALATLALPPAIRPARLGLDALLAAAETTAVAVLGFALWRGWRSARASGSTHDGPGEIPERIAAAARRAFGSESAADVLAFEVSILVYGLAGWRMKPATTSPRMTAYRECGWQTAVIGLGLVLLVETFPIHVLAARAHPAFAWLLTGLSLYSLLWLFGDYQALRLRPMRLAGDELWVRLGLRSSARIPLTSIREVRALEPGEAVRGRRDTLRAVLMGDATVAIDLAQPVVAKGAYGFRRSVTRVELAPDDPRGFLAEIQASLTSTSPRS